jgi:uncharacterized protein YkwD
MFLANRTFARAGGIVAAAAALAGVLGVPLATTAAASTYTPTLSSFDARLVYDINHARTSRGIRALTVVAGTTDVAHGWSCHMASVSLLSHNSRLGSQLDTHGSALWTTYGENVGVESSTAHADALFHAYMQSPEHRANILDGAYRYVGLWTKKGGGFRWNTIDFVGKSSSSYNYGYGGMKTTC